VLRRDARSSLSDINVTPFVDVMLVLLIFMVTAAIDVGVQVDLPQNQGRLRADEPLAVSIDKDGDLCKTAMELDTVVRACRPFRKTIPRCASSCAATPPWDMAGDGHGLC
jgi:biopolymer transport protein TolR